jgi:hypothetical protein
MRMYVVVAAVSLLIFPLLFIVPLPTGFDGLSLASLKPPPVPPERSIPKAESQPETPKGIFPILLQEVETLAGVHDPLSVAHYVPCCPSAGRRVELGDAGDLGFERGEEFEHEPCVFGLGYTR